MYFITFTSSTEKTQCLHGQERSVTVLRITSSHALRTFVRTDSSSKSCDNPQINSFRSLSSRSLRWRRLGSNDISDSFYSWISEWSSYHLVPFLFVSIESVRAECRERLILLERSRKTPFYYFFFEKSTISTLSLLTQHFSSLKFCQFVVDGLRSWRLIWGHWRV